MSNAIVPGHTPAHPLETAQPHGSIIMDEQESTDGASIWRIAILQVLPRLAVGVSLLAAALALIKAALHWQTQASHAWLGHALDMSWHPVAWLAGLGGGVLLAWRATAQGQTALPACLACLLNIGFLVTWYLSLRL